MKRMRWRGATVGAAGLALLVAGCGEGAPEAGKAEAGGPAEAATTEVELCDGETSTTVSSEMERSPENGRKVADELMAQWKRKNPDKDWVEAEHEKHKIVPPADNTDLVGKRQGQTYGRISEQDVATWRRELVKLVAEGSRVFHSADALGSEIAVSCDMCHPDAANTHPETYPKFQVQLGRVAHLRDMINWCIEHPVRGEVLDANSPEMRALEAYIYAQRKGTPLAYGKR